MYYNRTVASLKPFTKAWRLFSGWTFGRWNLEPHAIPGQLQKAATVGQKTGADQREYGSKQLVQLQKWNKNWQMKNLWTKHWDQVKVGESLERWCNAVLFWCLPSTTAGKWAKKTKMKFNNISKVSILFQYALLFWWRWHKSQQNRPNQKNCAKSEFAKQTQF